LKKASILGIRHKGNQEKKPSAELLSLSFPVPSQDSPKIERERYQRRGCSIEAKEQKAPIKGRRPGRAWKRLPPSGPPLKKKERGTRGPSDGYHSGLWVQNLVRQTETGKVRGLERWGRGGGLWLFESRQKMSKKWKGGVG